MRFVFFAVFILLPIFLHAQTDTLEYYLDYKDKLCTKEYAYYFRKGWKEGNLWRINDYYASKKLQMDGLFRDSNGDTEDGLITYYHKNGAISCNEPYKNGKKHGLITCFNKDGLQTISMFYKNDMATGTCKRWNDEGKLIYLGEFDTVGNVIGEEWRYYDNGNLLEHGRTCGYSNKRGVKKDSIWTYCDSNGKISSLEYYQKGKLRKTRCYIDGVVAKCNSNVRQLTSVFRKNEDLKQHLISALKECNTDSLKGLKGTIIVKMSFNIDGHHTVEIDQGIYSCVDAAIVNAFQAKLNSVPAIIIDNRPIRASISFCMYLPSGKVDIPSDFEYW